MDLLAIQEQHVTLETTREEIELGILRIEKFGRYCYRSEPKGNPRAFIEKLMRMGHDSVLEHLSLSYTIVTDRATSHQLVRHRLASYSQESQRYCRYFKDGDDIMQFIEPEGYMEWDKEKRDAFTDFLSHSGELYKDLLDMGEKPEVARAVLPNCTRTQMGMTANLREWREIYQKRTDQHAQKPIQNLLKAVKSEVEKLDFGWLFENFPKKS